MTQPLEATARRPVLYTEPCEGRQASPPNPNQATATGEAVELVAESRSDVQADEDASAPKVTRGTYSPCPATPQLPSPRLSKSRGNGLEACVMFRCTALEKALLLGRAEQQGKRVSRLMREALGLADSKRRRAMPKADPALIRHLGRMGSNLNQIARWLNIAIAAGHADQIDALNVATRLVAIERALSRVAYPAQSEPSENDAPPC